MTYLERLPRILLVLSLVAGTFSAWGSETTSNRERANPARALRRARGDQTHPHRVPAHGGAALRRHGNLYYTYIFETGVEGKQSWVDTGRGTEVFVRQDGRWVDVG